VRAIIATPISFIKGCIPVVDSLAHLVLGQAVALLDLAFQLLATAVDRVEIIVRQLAPLFLHPSLDLLPVSFHAVPIHVFAPFEKDVPLENVVTMHWFRSSAHRSVLVGPMRDGAM
jgi:hypothetical protein